MKNRIAKLLALLLCIAMVASMFTACVDYSDEGNEFPINYDIDLAVIGKMIDDLCDMSNIINPPVAKAGEQGT